MAISEFESRNREFEERNREFSERMASDGWLQVLSREWFNLACRYEYSYHFTWMGRPIIQFPADIIAIQEVIWKTRPDLIIETGIAHGGSLILSASILELLGGDGKVLGIDIDIRPHNRAAIEAHPLFHRIRMIEGSSVAVEVADQARAVAAGSERVMVILDSNHTHEHVRQELELYSPLVTPGNYLIVLDTIIEEMPADAFPNRPWGPGNNPRTALQEFLRTSDRFEIDREIQNKLLLSVAPDGYLKCVRA